MGMPSSSPVSCAGARGRPPGDQREQPRHGDADCAGKRYVAPRRQGMSYRIAVGEVAHETNTFVAPTTIEPFKRYMWLRGDEIAAAHAGNRTYVGGMLDRAAGLGVTAVPTFVTMAYPSGTITAAAYREILDELLRAIERALPLDAVCLSLHGAGVAEGVDDLEGDLLRRVRELVGPGVPIAAALDLHGNITPGMLEQD